MVGAATLLMTCVVADNACDAPLPKSLKVSVDVVLALVCPFAGVKTSASISEVMFAGLAAGMLKTVPNIAETVALVAGMIFAGQVLIGAALALTDLAREATAGGAR